MTIVRPTGNRYLFLPAAPLLAAGFYVPPALPAKDAGDTLIYAVDFAAIIQDSKATILYVNPAWSDATNIAVLSAYIQGTTYIFEIQGGLNGTTVQLSFTVGMSDGQVFTRQVVLPVVMQTLPVPKLIWSYDYSQASNSGVLGAW